MPFGSVCVYIIIVHVTEFVSSEKDTAVGQEKMWKSAYPSAIKDAGRMSFKLKALEIILNEKGTCRSNLGV